MSTNMSERITIKDVLNTAKQPSILKRSTKVALIVGTILMFINHGDAIFAGELESARLGKIIITYFVPFLVSTQASVTATLHAMKQPSAALSSDKEIL
ncbi:nitrate/nitrite transporter NrtS [Vibrio sp. DW001]|uniref:nitrate/nitrite transporter NrtS n=1 Tax=Vibrio sp. DW001 TaxID=2912315 RepID=UPI0023AFB64F|nr:nitrate/nitrite transporter NrtS [Vibrio sp. DW001]WED27295.1 nitrate/nitrite transporter NrtS [Vibrio sp. DW001]